MGVTTRAAAAMWPNNWEQSSLRREVQLVITVNDGRCGWEIDDQRKNEKHSGPQNNHKS